MALAPAPNPRASLLAGLRTGGVRSASTTVPHTAALGSSFNPSRFASQRHPSPLFDDEVDGPQLNFNPYSSASHFPMTAAVDGPNNSFATQQMPSRSLNPNSVPFNPTYKPNAVSPLNPTQMQNQVFQMQLLQLEMLRIQNLQAQQLHAERFRPAQYCLDESQFHGQHHPTFSSPPTSATPAINSFDLRSMTTTAEMRRVNQIENLRSRVGQATNDEVPMTAALGGKFGSRTTNFNVSGSNVSEGQESSPFPAANTTTVISGGISLGNPASSNLSNKGAVGTASKSESASTWRRTGNNNPDYNRLVSSSPTVKITPPIEQPVVSPSLPHNIKLRPQPLRFDPAVQTVTAVTIEVSDGNDTDDASSSSSAASNSSPNTPKSFSSNGAPLSPREEVPKKLYDGIGIGRPVSALPEQQYLNPSHPFVSLAGTHRLASQPTRQPRGPPSGADELGPKNFASRIRRQAIDGLGMLMDARERRDLVEAY